ncbi:hypothetical protein BXZ70DRAFT_45798 [Cristinia sonorae]|uniref:Uncharacterized protein n=1 Tax=Cristinia sonorae TaxID=1940300 RepID=A0A8K0V1A5_9AGAR|nr:hypothetical protein BXZ70DRAFT_45798 [Cristinia sonorae]
MQLFSCLVLPGSCFYATPFPQSLYNYTVCRPHPCVAITVIAVVVYIRYLFNILLLLVLSFQLALQRSQQNTYHTDTWKSFDSREKDQLHTRYHRHKAILVVRLAYSHCTITTLTKTADHKQEAMQP